MSLIKVTECLGGVEVSVEIDLTKFEFSNIPPEVLRILVERSVRENLAKVVLLTYSALHASALAGAFFQLINDGLRAAARSALDLAARAEAGEDPVTLTLEVIERGSELIKGSDSGDEPKLDLDVWGPALDGLDLDL